MKVLVFKFLDSDSKKLISNVAILTTFNEINVKNLTEKIKRRRTFLVTRTL
jgi:hypothetical protein